MLIAKHKNMDPLNTAKTRLFQTVSVFMWVLCLVAVAGFFFILNASKAITVNNDQTKTITVDGKSERYVSPDFARISFTESQKATTAAEAQDKATKKINSAIAYLKDAGVNEKDIKTTNYQIYPIYEYYYWNEATGLRCLSSYCNPPYVQKENIVGYRVEQSVEVKIRKVADAGKILSGLGAVGIQNIGGLSLEIENIDKITEEVKNEAIKDARAKAKERAKSLGVSLGDVVSVSDNYGGGIYYGRGVATMEAKVGYNAVADGTPTPIAPEINPGQNKIEATVNVTYEIK